MSLTAYVRYDNTGRIVPGGPIVTSIKPKVGDWVAVDDVLTTVPNYKLRGFIRYIKNGNYVAGSLILQHDEPQDGNWKEVYVLNPACCATTTTTTSSSTSTTTTTTSSTSSTSTTTTTTTAAPACDTLTITGLNANTTANSATKTTAGGWDASAYSTETYTTPVTLTFQTSTNGNYLMGGFAYTPTANAETYTNTTYGLYVQNDFLEIYENGGQVNVPGAITTLSTDVWKVVYNGTTVTYYQNNVLIYTSANPVTQPLHVFFALLTPEEGVNNICAV